MGFEGWVMSDWGATHSTVDAANHGLDQEMAEFDTQPAKAHATMVVATTEGGG